MNSTNIPQPSSILRTSTGNRLSTASASRYSFLGKGFIDPISNSVKRKSLLSTPASTTKRRQSYIPPSSSQQSAQQTPQPSQQTPILQTPTFVDQRPLRDKNYQLLIQQEIFEFLVTNKFELETNHSITSKTLKQPTQKDFTLIFKFLYNKIDPFYTFTRSIENEVFSVLRNLNYPYLDGINRSQISAVGGQNWPSFLGMLYWLVKLNLSLVNVKIDDELTSSDDEFDRIFIQYIRNSYNSFINEGDDYSEFYEEMKTQFDALNENLVKDITNLDQENSKLQEEYNQLNEQLTVLEQSERKSEALENDLIKFKAYIETMEARKYKWSDVLDKIRDESAKCEEELLKIDGQKKELELKIQEQGLTIDAINNFNEDKDKLTKTIESLQYKIEDIRAKSNEIELIKNYQSLENFIRQYNNLIFKIKSENYDFEIKLNSEILDIQDIGFKPHDVINKILKDEKIELLKYRNQINNKIHQYEDEQIKLQEQSDLIAERILEKRETIDSLESKLTANKLNYEEIYETMVNNSTAYSTQIERLERDLRSMKIVTNQGYIELENKYQNILIEKDQMNHELVRQRSKIQEQTYDIAEFIMNFKLNIHSNLLEMDDLATMEYENAQKEVEIQEV